MKFNLQEDSTRGTAAKLCSEPDLGKSNCNALLAIYLTESPYNSIELCY